MTFDDWDVLPPNEQARRLADYVGQNVLPQRLNALAQEMANAIAQREQLFRNYTAILTDAFSRKFENRDLDLQQYMQKALDYSQGRVNPLEAAYSEVTREATLKKRDDETYQRAKEATMQSLSTPPRDEISIFKKPALSRTAVKDAVRSESASKGLGWGNDNGWVPPPSNEEGK